VAFANGNTVTFTDTGAGTVNITTSGVLPANTTVNSASVYTFSGGAIGGSGGLTKLNSGTLNIANSNTYTGGTTVIGGLLSVLAAGSLSSSSNLTINNTGSASFANTQTLGTVTNSSTAAVGLAFTSAATLSQLTGSGTSSFGAAATVTQLLTSGTTTFSTTASVTTFTSGTATVVGAATFGAIASGTATFNSTANITTISGGTVTASGIATIATISGGTLRLASAANITNFSAGNVTVTGVATIGTVSGGNLTLSAATSAITSLGGAGAVTLSGTNLTVTGGSFGGTLANGPSAGQLSVNGTFTMAGTDNLIATGDTLTLTGANIAGNINQTGSGTLVILGNYTGTTNVGSGSTLNASPGSTGNVALSNGAVLDFTTAGSYSGNVTLSSAGSAIIENTSGGIVTLTGTIDKSHANLGLVGPGSFWVNGVITGGTAGVDFNSDMTFSTNTTLSSQQAYSGPTTISSGATVWANINNALPTNTILNLGDGSNTTGAYNLAGNSQTLAGIVAFGSGTTNAITSTASGGQLFVNVASGVDSYSGSLTGSLGLHKEGAGTLRLSGGSNSYTGATTIDAGTLQLGTNSGLSTTTLSLASGGTFDMNGRTQQVASLESSSSTATVTGSTGSVLNVSHSAAMSSIYAGVVSGQVSLAFNGVALSAEVLSGAANNYSGSTTINSGALIVNGSITGAGGAVTVNSSDANNPGVLAGNNTSNSINRDVNIASGSGSGGVISPGNDAPNISSPTSTALAGVLNIGGNLTIGGTYLWDLTTNSTAGAGVNFDRVTLNSGTLTGAGGTLELVLTGAGVPSNTAFWQTHEQWAVITGVGTVSSLFSLLDPTGAGNYGGLGSFSLASLTTDQAANAILLDWNPTAVPEPGTMLLASLASLGLSGYGWRKRKSKVALSA
jgi:autotransporter-associated beta strand protein